MVTPFQADGAPPAGVTATIQVKQEFSMPTRSSRCGFLLAFALVMLLAPAALAEEGMWTFDNIPLKLLKEKYGFIPTQAWLDHLRLSSVRLSDGGSGAFVTSSGLLLTNDHVARTQLGKNSSSEHNYLRDGFYADRAEKEMKSQDLEVDVLVGMQDVTTRVVEAAKGVPDETKALRARESEVTAIARESRSKTGLRSEVVSLYMGGEYWLYQYKAYTDVRLVFAPEEQAASFGGDPDNFTYPRYALDMAVFRVYENGKPLHSENYLKWSTKGAAPGELVFTAGHPAATERQLTMDELALVREYVMRPTIQYYERRIAAAKAFAAKGPEQARLMEPTIVAGENAQKVLNGRYAALIDKAVMAKRQSDEDDFRRRIAGNPEWQKEYGGVWDAVAAVDRKAAPREEAALFRRTDSRLFSIARQIVQYVAEEKKPDGERLEGYHEGQLESARSRLLSPAPIDLATEELFMNTALHLAEEKLGRNDEYLQALLQGSDVDAFVESVVHGTKLTDPAFRQALLDGGDAAITACSDPAIVAARRTDTLVRGYIRWNHDELESVITPAGEKLGRARFLVYGRDTYPDATFTLRLSYGTVKGYPYNGTIAPPFTTFYGLYDRAASFDYKAPFDLAPAESKGRNTIDLATPLDFVTTNDITGGNSGSPVVNRAGELVGVIFDGNIESLAGEYVYEGDRNRAVAVHSAAMIEVLRKLYGAGALADELLGKP
jgi:hypothetical protein